jgi:uncharacterized protein|mmetsp:Transcript_98784/g.156232  ORF Transcript_98784/g.156232 Transcript_98784/m.156232 type:complete len:361 (-) Transcript_98784:111-1193(-)
MAESRETTAVLQHREGEGRESLSGFYDYVLDFVGEAVELVMNNHDGSHDFQHIERVYNILKTMLDKEKKAFLAGVPGSSNIADEDAFVAKLATLLHDVDDHKYTKGENHAERIFQSLFNEPKVKHICNSNEFLHKIKARVEKIIGLVSYSRERKWIKTMDDELAALRHMNKEVEEASGSTSASSDEEGKETHFHFADGSLKTGELLFERRIIAKEPVLAYVQDADRLDAIGAIGVARCFSYGGAMKRPLYTKASADIDVDAWEAHRKQETEETTIGEPPTKRAKTELAKASVSTTLTKSIAATGANYSGGSEDCIIHFYEKLFFLKDRLRTKVAKEIALKRHDAMVSFIRQLRGEVLGIA